MVDAVDVRIPWSARSARRSTLRADAYTASPALFREIAVALPIPEEHPVMRIAPVVHVKVASAACADSALPSPGLQILDERAPVRGREVDAVSMPGIRVAGARSHTPSSGTAT